MGESSALVVNSLTFGRVELDAVLLAPAGMVNIGRGGGDHPVVVVDLLQLGSFVKFGEFELSLDLSQIWGKFSRIQLKIRSKLM